MDLVRGGDYSRFQGTINWDQVPAERRIAILGMWDWRNLVVDDQLARNVAEAKRTKRVVGGYMRTNPPRWTAEVEAKRMVDLLAQYDLDTPGCLWPSVDIERTNTPADAIVNWRGWTREFFGAWRDITKLPLLVYTSGSWFQELLGGTDDWPDWVRCWVGHSEKYSRPAGLPREEWAGKTWHEPNRAVIHQYSTTGTLLGIAGAVDLDCLMPGVALESITLQGSGGDMGVIAPRASWGPSCSNGATDSNGRSIIIGVTAWRDIYVHHTVTSVPGGANATVAQEQQHMRDLERIGQNSFGQGISYTVLVFPSGRAYQGHDIDRRGAHTYQRNDSARAICFVGNFENDQPTAAAINTACLVLDEWKAKGYPSRITGGHRDVYATACPGKNLYAALSRIKAGAGQPQEGEDDMPLKDQRVPLYPDADAPDQRTETDAAEALGRAVQAGWASHKEVAELRTEFGAFKNEVMQKLDSIGTGGVDAVALAESVRTALGDEVYNKLVLVLKNTKGSISLNVSGAGGL